MAKKEIVYQQRFQNAYKTLDLVIYSKPKAVQVNERQPTKFNRKCLTKEKLEHLAKVIERNDDKILIQNNDLNFKMRKSIEDNKFKKVVTQPRPIANQVKWGEILELQNSNRPSCTPEYNVKMRKIELNKNANALLRPSTEKPDHKLDNCSKKKLLKTRPINLKTNHDRPISNVFSNTIRSSSSERLEVKDSKKSDSGTLHIRKSSFDNMDNVGSGDQTHSPFGESALQLLHQLRERLKSQGDDESSNMISAIIKKSDNDSPTSLYHTAFSTPNPINSLSAMEDKYKMRICEQETKIAEQGKKIQAQALVIQELREMSSKLLEYHEQTNLHKKLSQSQEKISFCKSQEMEEEVCSAINNCDIPSLEAEKKAEVTLKQLSLENQSLLKKVKSQLQFILNLELELANLKRHLKKVENQQAIIDYEGHYGQFVQLRSKEQKVLREESEVDSAFDEKMISPSASGSSPVSNAASHSKSTTVQRCFTSNSSLNHDPNVLESHKPSEANVTNLSHICNVKSILMSDFKDLRSFHVEDKAEGTLKGIESVPISFISEMATDTNCTWIHSGSFDKDHPHTDNISAIGVERIFPVHHYQYLESTHVEKQHEIPKISPSSLKPLNNIEICSSDSDDSRVRPIYKSVNQNSVTE